jgi:hypothetical protein
MANIKILDLSALEAQPSTDDYFVIVDTSEAADADKTKKIDFGYAIKTYADSITETVFASYPEVTPSARVYNNADISINNDTATALTFNSELYDTDTIHDTSTNTGRLTCKTAGIYTIFANVAFNTNSTGYRSTLIKHNGSTTIALMVTSPASGAYTIHNLSCQYNMAVNDYVEVVVQQTSTGALLVKRGASYSPEFGMTFQGKAST